MDRIRFLMYREQRILLVDLVGCEAEEIAKVADLLPEIVTSEPKGSVLLLGDFGGAKFKRQAVERVKIAAAYNQPHIRRAAWVLSENLPKALYDSILTFSAREIPVFSARQDALDYLVG